MTTPATTPPRTAASVLRAVPAFLLNALRGALIGMAELLPGISGGTIALITGVYERLIDSASAVVSAVKRLVFGPDRRAGFGEELRRVEWMLIVPVIVGMGAMVLTLAGFIEGLVSANAEMARGLFFGLVAASIMVPLQLIPRARRTAGAHVGGAAVFVLAAAGAFFSVEFAAGAIEVEPPLWVVFFAAMVAVCALVLPGVSGSFFLLAIGLYSPTLIAVDERDLAYLGVFAAGALVGLVTIVRLMKWLLDHHRRLTLIAMAGLMLGSLRALWPWQTLPAGEDHGVGTLTAPYDPVLGPVVLAVIGAATVLVLVAVERRLQRQGAPIQVIADEPAPFAEQVEVDDAGSAEPAPDASATSAETDAAAETDDAGAEQPKPTTRAELRRSARAQNTRT
ncbi:DUF368 domain-containing protein [Microbacterium thalassium]|uniref:Putative membrane protein n=1 Tax=Microbacterium thalassium TaxID=362649 RepID=A0A7X0KWB7_9MICO|nr:DUF368 domain-containing protein [Microbacterium thalassium]MBB6392959.1 putative membrane protein [Microbacterium thalassium]GLK22809.1 DUF368 domain-containing protein [Microbacterium thalassium]